jgi:Amiloride-sensitive sodium channel.
MLLVLVQVIDSCKELFMEECWWRNKYYDCCSLFELQKTEYGFCYSFNSETSECRHQ